MHKKYRKRIYISREQKEKIIKELIQENCNIKLLATRYQITAKTLSKWRNDYYKAEKGRELTDPEQHFVEVQVSKDIKKNQLKKVELLLDNHKCSIEGRLNSEQLIKLLQILEEASC
jgi:transposase-like protein